MNNQRPLRVLHLPVNIRWIMDATIKGENELGIETQRFLISRAGLDESSQERVDFIPHFQGRKKSLAYLSYLLKIVKFFARYARLVAWADVIHWQYSNRLWLTGGILKNLDFVILKFFKKPAVVQFHGGDFRNSALWVKTNPWWSEAYEKNFMEELDVKAKLTQENFAKAGFCFAMGYGMLPFVTEENTSRAVALPRAIELKAYENHRQRFSGKKVTIVHAPSHPTSKGSHYIVEAIRHLEERYPIEFILLQEMNHEEVLEQLSKADIVVDQLLCGDYGLLAVEALNAGAVVVANVNEELRKAYPEKLPIVQADPDTIESVLEDLILHPETSQATAQLGPAYAQCLHGYRRVVPEALKAYRFAALKMKGKKRLVQKLDRYIELAESQLNNK